MTDIEKVTAHLMDFINDLVMSKKIFDIQSFDFDIQYRSSYRQENDEPTRKNFNEVLYKINMSLNLTPGWNSVYLHTESYDDPYKCLIAVKFKIENEIKLKESMAKLNKKIATSFDELSFLESELQEALENEHYEQADELKKKIKALKKKTKK